MAGPAYERQAPDPGAAPRFPESHLAEVLYVNDPDNLGRVQIKLLSYDGPDNQSGPVWARVAVAVAGASRGTWLIPDVGDEVLVTFVGGDPRRPIVVGSLWNGRDTPTEQPGSRGIDRWTFTSKDGTVISVVEESSGSATVKVEVPGGVTAELTQSSGGKIELEAAGSTVKIDTQGVTIETGGSVSVTASRISMSAGSVNVDAGMASFSGVVQCSTLIATTVVGTTYTPGAGNVW